MSRLDVYHLQTPREAVTLGTGTGLGPHYEIAFEHACRNMPGRLGDPVIELAHEFAVWAVAPGGWEAGHVDAAFTRWMIDVKAPIRAGLAGDDIEVNR